MSFSIKINKNGEHLRQEQSYYLEETAKSRQLIKMVHDELDDDDDRLLYNSVPPLIKRGSLSPKHFISSISDNESSIDSGRSQPEMALEGCKLVRAIAGMRNRRRFSTGLVEKCPTGRSAVDDMGIQGRAWSTEEQLERTERRESIMRKNESSYKLNKLLLEFYALFCHVDLFARDTIGEPNPRPKLKLRLFSESKIDCAGCSRPSVKKSIWSESKFSYLWPKIILLAYIISSCHVVCNLFYQYQYDYYLFRLKRVRWLKETQPSEIIAKLDLEQEDALLANIEREQQQLTRIGAPHLHLSFAAQCIYLYVLLTALCTYLLPAIYFRFKATFDFYFVRNFLNYSGEHRYNWRFVKHQVVSFIKSSSNHVRALEEFSFRSIGKRLSIERHQASQQALKVGTATKTNMNMTDKTSGQAQVIGANVSNKLASMASRSHRQLIEMFENNDLRPMNQSSKWIERQATWYCLLCMACNVYAAIILLSFAVSLIIMQDSSHQLTWQDRALMAELLFLVAVPPVSTVFYGTLLIFTCLDLSILANKLRTLMSHVINLNTMRFYKNLHLKIRHDNIRQTRRISLISLRECPPTANYRRDIVRQHQDLVRNTLIDTHAQLIKFDSSYEAKMNNDLLLALMQYRIFVCQLRAHTKATNKIAMTAVFIMFIFPILYRLHLPYIDKTSDINLSCVVVYLCCLIVGPVNMCLLPACYLHKRCLEVYNQLNSFLAHATDVISHPEGRDIYDGHILSMLRKEMMYPDRVATKFALKCAGISFTYSSLVRFQFYFGFIILSIFSESRNSNQEVSGTIFSDPFGLF